MSLSPIYPALVRIDLSETDVDHWREAVLHGAPRPLRAQDREHIDALWRELPTGGAVVGDVALNDAAVEAADAASPVSWQPEPHGFTGTAVCVVIMLCTVAWFGFRIITSTGAA